MKVCEMCGAQNDDVFTKCSVCGADLPSPNGDVGDDEKTVLIDPTEAAAPKSGLSLKTDTSTYGQADANAAQPQPGFGGQPQGMPGQPGFGGQPQGMPGQPGFGGQPQGMPGQAPYGQPGFGGQPQGMPGQAPYGQPGFGGSAPEQPKSKKGLIFGILGAAVVVLAVALILIFKGGNGAKSPEDVARLFIEAMDEKDADKMAKLCPPFLDPGKDEIEDMISSYDGMDVKFTYEGVESKDEYTGDDLKDFEDEVSDYADKDIKLQGACDLEFSFNIKVSYLGQDYDESNTYTLTCIKYKGKWYLYE